MAAMAVGVLKSALVPWASLKPDAAKGEPASVETVESLRFMERTR
jgi:hypothetical protein